jgi:hypothetical protein
MAIRSVGIFVPLPTMSRRAQRDERPWPPPNRPPAGEPSKRKSAASRQEKRRPNSASATSTTCNQITDRCGVRKRMVRHRVRDAAITVGFGGKPSPPKLKKFLEHRSGQWSRSCRLSSRAAWWFMICLCDAQSEAARQGRSPAARRQSKANLQPDRRISRPGDVRSVLRDGARACPA